MADTLVKCGVCRALLDDEDLFCANCGTEAPLRLTTQRPTTHISTHNFECRGCGASMSYDASARTLRCPFCGSERLDKQRDVEVLAPNRVVPFQLSRERALEVMKQWLGRGFWRPGDLAVAAVVTKMAKVYLPYWVFRGKTITHWSADSSKVPFGARGNWYPLTGSHHGEYDGLLIGASSVLTPNETSAICPFDLSQGTDPSAVDLNDVTVEQFRVQRKYARPLARLGLEELERQACAQYVPGRHRNLHVNVRLDSLASEPVLLPVWIMAYTYNRQVYRFLVSGQTGKATGNAPVSWIKVSLAAFVAAVVVILVVVGFLFTR